MKRSLQHQRGVALLVALLVVALATILIAALLDRGELALARTRNALRGEQAEAYAQGLEAYAAEVLQKKQGSDTNTSPWMMPLPTQPVPGGLIAASMRDQNGCFNLNNLAPTVSSSTRQKWRKIFTQLLEHVGAPSTIEQAVEAWLDPNAPSESNFYLAQPVPYRPRGGLFAHVSELRLVRGVTGEVYARLAPHVCALPPNTLINVNTATMHVLWSMLNNGTQADAERLWRGGQANYGGPDEFLREAGPSSSDSIGNLLAINSTYFLARSDILLDSVPFTFYSLIQNDGKGGVRVLQRSRGADTALAAAAPIAASDAP